MPNKGELFWDRFIESKSNFENFARLDISAQEHLIDELLFTLHDFSPGLFFEISNQRPYELIITAQGIADYFGQAEYLVGQAPPIEDWKIIALKPALGGDFEFEVNNVYITEADLSFVPVPVADSPETIAIKIIHADMPAEGVNDDLRTDLIMGIYAQLDAHLGERAVALDIGLLDFGSAASPDEEPMPLSSLASYIDWKKKERANFEVRYPEQAYLAFEGEVDGSLKQLIADSALDYYSYKSDYPYLNILLLGFEEADEDGFPFEEELIEIQQAEASMAHDLRASDLGHHCLSETGDDKREIWLYMKDDESVDQILSRHPGIQSKIISITSLYDPYWVKAGEFIK